MSLFLLAIIIFFAYLTLSLTGFGHALVAMPFLVPLLGVHIAAPLVALTAVTGEVIMLIRYRRQLNFRTVWRLIIAALCGVPLGVALLRQADPRIVLLILGLVSSGYGLYALLDLRLPEIHHPNWAFAFGFVTGLLSGAYNTGGPPVVIYGNCRRWPPAEFKSSLQGLFIAMDITIVLTHAVSGNFTPPVWQGYVIAVPALLLGLFAGFQLERRVDPALFRKLVLILLIVAGLRLILTA
jgi:hypothetical protein